MVQETASTIDESASSNSGDVPQVPRRNLLKELMAAAVGLLVGAVPLATGMLFFLDPLLRKNQDKKTQAGNRSSSGIIKDENGFIKMPITTDAIPSGGTPQSFTVYDDKIDAWNVFLKQPVGTVWLRKTENDEVVAFSTICPHLGCSIEYRQSRKDFYCPCHLSAFELNGAKKNRIPPRGMDTLQLKPDTGNEVWIKYEEFRGTLAEKTPV